MVCNNALTQSTFANCSVVGASISLGLGQSPSSLSLNLVEDVTGVYCAFNGYNGQIGSIYTANVGGLQYHGILTDHNIKLNAGGRTVDATLGDGRDFLANAKIITGKYYGSRGVYETCNSSINTLNIMSELEPGVSSQFSTFGCNNYLTKKCDSSNGFMASGRDKSGMPVFSILRMFLTPRYLSLPLTNQTLRVNLDDLFLKCLIANELHPDRLGKGLFLRIHQNSISILEFIETVCRDIACDFYVFIRPYQVSPITLYEIVVKLVDRSVDVAQITDNSTILRDYISDNYIGSGDFASSITTDIQYGQELTNEPTKKIVFGDYYKYFAEIREINPNLSDWSGHVQYGSFPPGWNTGFGYDGDPFTPAGPGAITGVAPGNNNPIDTNPYSSLVYSSGQTLDQDLLPCDVSGIFGTGIAFAACQPILGHRIFQVLGEKTMTGVVDTDDIATPTRHKLFLTNFCDDGGFSIDYDVKALEDAIDVDLGLLVTSAPLTHQELMMSSNFELYKQWCLNHPNSIGGKFGEKIYGALWTQRAGKVISTLFKMLAADASYDLVTPYIVDRTKDAKFEIVQQFVKQIYDDYYGTEFAVLLDRKQIGDSGVVNLYTHDICLAKSYNLSIIEALNNGGVSESIIEPSDGNLDRGWITAYPVNGDEPNFEISDKIAEGAWFSGPNHTGVLGLTPVKLQKFQNSDGTISGFVNLGPYKNVCRKLGSLIARLDAEDSAIQMDNMVIQSGNLYVKATFDSNLYFGQPDLGSVLSYDDGGDYVWARFSIPKIPLKKKILSFNDEVKIANTAHAELFSIMDGGTYKSETDALTTIYNEVFKMVDTSGNEENDGAQNDLSQFTYADMNQFALFPREVAVPFESQTQIYGPFSYAANLSGLVEVEDTELSPWQFVSNLSYPNAVVQSWNDMLREGQDTALHGVRSRLFQEKASVNLVGIPSISLTTGLELAANAGSVLSNVNINYGSNGATTNLTFSTYSKRFAQTEKYIKDATKDLIKAKKDLNQQIREQKNKNKRFESDSRSKIKQARESKE